MLRHLVFGSCFYKHNTLKKYLSYKELLILIYFLLMRQIVNSTEIGRFFAVSEFGQLNLFIITTYWYACLRIN